jgi:hypothetical protein
MMPMQSLTWFASWQIWDISSVDLTIGMKMILTEIESDWFSSFAMTFE